jgi:hypothetical protein
LRPPLSEGGHLGFSRGGIEGFGIVFLAEPLAEFVVALVVGVCERRGYATLGSACVIRSTLIVCSQQSP